MSDSSYSLPDHNGNSPVAEPAHAVSQIAPGLILWVYKGFDVDFGQCICYHLAQIFGELGLFAKGRLPALHNVSHFASSR